MDSRKSKGSGGKVGMKKRKVLRSNAAKQLFFWHKHQMKMRRVGKEANGLAKQNSSL